MLTTIKGVLAAAVAANGTFTVNAPANGQDLKQFQAQFGLTSGAYYGAMGHSLVIGGNQPLVNVKDFTITLTSQTVLTITNKTSGTWPAGSAFILQLDQRGQRWYQDNDPAFARKTMAMSMVGLCLINLGNPATASATGVLASIAAQTTSPTGVEKCTATVYLDTPRAVSITSSSASDTSAFSAKITGTDVYGQVMSETIAFNGAATVQGNKAFNTVTSVKMIHASSTALTGTVTVGTTTKLGLPVFVPSAGFVVKEIDNGAAATAGTFAYGITTAGGSTATTGDVRGTYIPNTAPDGAHVYELLIAAPDPGCIGVPQFAG